MRTFLLLLVSCLLPMGSGGSARADVVPFTGSLSVTVGSLAPLVVPGAGLMTVNAPPADFPITLVSLPSGAFATTISVPLPNAFPIVGLQVQVSNPAAVFSVFASPCGTPHPLVACSGDAILHGRAGLAGSAFVGIFGTGSAPFANLTVPLGAAGAGSTASAASPLGITLRLSGAGWTSGTAAVISPGGGTFTAMGGQDLELPGGGGGFGPLDHPGEAIEITLVSPLQIYTNATGGYLPSFVRWTIRFEQETPEPGAALLLATGVLGVGWAVRRRQRRQRR